MKLSSKKHSLIAATSLLIGIFIGSQIPGLIESYNLWRGEKNAFEQLKKSDNKANSWLLISQWRWRRGDIKGSFEAAHKALEYDPNFVLAIEKIGYNYLEIGELNNAKEWLEKALKTAAVHAPGQIEMLKFSIAHVENEMKP